MRQRYVFQRQRKKIGFEVQPAHEEVKVHPVHEEKKLEPVKEEPVKEIKKVEARCVPASRPAALPPQTHSVEQVQKTGKAKPAAPKEKMTRPSRHRKPAMSVRRRPMKARPAPLAKPIISPTATTTSKPATDDFVRLSKAYENVESTNLEKVLNRLGRRER